MQFAALKYQILGAELAVFTRAFPCLWGIMSCKKKSYLELLPVFCALIFCDNSISVLA